MAPAETIAVVVAFCPAPGQVDEVSLRLPCGSTLQQALQASGLLQRQGLQLQQVHTGIWGRVQSLDAVLRERDRVELYRPLLVDPKEARRLRYGRHKAAAQARKLRSAAQTALTPADKRSDDTDDGTACDPAHHPAYLPAHSLADSPPYSPEDSPEDRPEDRPEDSR